jgi:hypothetical protein
MAEEELRVSVLAERIARGQAEPISDEEQQIADGLRSFYEKKFGRNSTPERARSWLRRRSGGQAS